MIELKRILAPVDDTPFDEICSFETANYIGIFVDNFPDDWQPGFVILPKGDSEFSLDFVKFVSNLERLDDIANLERLDDIVFEKTAEHINGVSTSRCLEIKINEDY